MEVHNESMVYTNEYVLLIKENSKKKFEKWAAMGMEKMLTWSKKEQVINIDKEFDMFNTERFPTAKIKRNERQKWKIHEKMNIISFLRSRFSKLPKLKTLDILLAYLVLFSRRFISKLSPPEFDCTFTASIHIRK